MLGKLFAHEWKDSWKIMSILNGAVLVWSFIGIFFVIADQAVDLKNQTDAGSTITILMYSSYTMIYVLSIFALSIGSTLYFYIRFYRNLYTDQGYLMHTLPVSDHELILSKALVAIIWRLIGSVIMIIGIVSVITVFMRPVFIADSVDLRDLINAFDVFDQNPVYVFLSIILALLLGIGSVVFSVFMGYAAISIGQLVSKNKVLASIGVYFGIHMVINIVSNVFTQGSMLVLMHSGESFYYNLEHPGPMLLAFMFVACIAVYAVSVGFYCITHVIMKNRLNLD